MLPEPNLADPPPVLRVEAFADPGRRHGFSTRHVGIPHGGRLEAALPGFLSAAGFAPSCQVQPLHQVHGRGVHVVRHGPPHVPEPTADGAVTDRPGVVLMVRTADCVPVLLASPQMVGVAHAGWRGALAGVLEETLASMTGLGARLPSIQAALGPAIGPCCFQVSAQVAAPFSNLQADLVTEGADGPRVDLPGAVAFLLERAGVARGAIHRMAACTRCRGDLFFSHRGEAGRTGRLIAAVGLG